MEKSSGGWGVAANGVCGWIGGFSPNFKNLNQNFAFNAENN